MEKFILEPLKGIGKVNFGDSRATVHSVMGKPAVEHEKVDYYFDAAVRFDYDENGGVEFIEFSNDEGIDVEIFGENPFVLKAKELEDLLAKMNADGLVDAHQAPFCYAFDKIVVGIYRDATEQDILISIDEAKQDGTYEEDKDWLNEELEKYSHFQTIGIGREGYYIAN